MAFTPLSLSVLISGGPVSQDWVQLVKTNFDDHETRIATASVNSGLLPPIAFDVEGYVDPTIIMSGLLVYRVPNNVNILGARLFVVTAGSAGTLTIDIQYKRGAGAWTSILSAPISAGFGLGSLALVSGTLAVSTLQTGDLVRLNVSAIQTGMVSFSAYLEVQGS